MCLRELCIYKILSLTMLRNVPGNLIKPIKYQAYNSLPSMITSGGTSGIIKRMKYNCLVTCKNYPDNYIYLLVFCTQTSKMLFAIFCDFIQRLLRELSTTKGIFAVRDIFEIVYKNCAASVFVVSQAMVANRGLELV